MLHHAFRRRGIGVLFRLQLEQKHDIRPQAQRPLEGGWQGPQMSRVRWGCFTTHGTAGTQPRQRGSRVANKVDEMRRLRTLILILYEIAI